MRWSCLVVALLVAPAAHGLGTLASVTCSETSPLDNHCTAGLIRLRNGITVGFEVTGYVGHLRIQADDQETRVPSGLVWDCDFGGTDLERHCTSGAYGRPESGDEAMVTCLASPMQNVPVNEATVPVPVALVGPVGAWTCTVAA